jgi:hypothetical protein
MPIQAHPMIRSRAMETELQLRAAVVAAVGALRQIADPVDDRVHQALTVLDQALAISVETPDAEGASAGDGDELVERVRPRPRSLSDYRQERGMSIPQFTDWLGIAHFEYAHVVHRQPVDPRLRDQIAFRLGVSWTQIAEFLPLEPPPPEPVPATAGPPREPWYLIEVLSGPHETPLPANACYLGDPATGAPTNFVVLHDDWPSEEEQLPPEGYTAAERRELYGDDAELSTEERQ